MSASSTTNTNNQPPPSPWKKPKVVSLSRSKSLKRRPDFLNPNATSENNHSNDELNQPQPKISKNIFNRFSVNTNLTNFNFSNSETEVLNFVINSQIEINIFMFRKMICSRFLEVTKNRKK